MQFVDLDLVRRLEASEAHAAQECAQFLSRKKPQSSAISVDIMGGIATFTGIGSPVTQAVGLGLHGAVSGEEMDSLEEFYRSRGSEVNIEVCPMAHISLYEQLGHRGYRVIELSDVLYRQIEPPARPTTLPPGIEIRRTTPAEARLWAETVSRGFAEHFPVTEELIEIMEMFSQRLSDRAYLAYADGKIAGGAALCTHNNIAGCFGASTLPDFRRRGVQTALLETRLADAAEAGCNIAMSIAQLNSASHRNIVRQGFRVAYTRSKFMRKWD
jgi:GNAT superfamily N-acetyltransferase